MTAISMVEDSMFEDSMQIALDEGWFDMASLVAVARCNKQLHSLVDRADHLWEPFLAEIKFPQTGFVDETDWKSPDIPSLNDDFDLRVPPRINGGRRDDHSFFVHPRDKNARGRGLFLPEHAEPWLCKSMFDQTTGILKDLFHSENEVLVGLNPFRRCIYIPRALPIECKACRVMLDSYPALVSHCKQWSHKQNMDEIGGDRVPEEFVDPRNTQSYHQDLSVFRKVMALKTFECKLIDLLHAPLDQDGIDDIARLQHFVLESVSESVMEGFEAECLLSTITLEKVKEARIEFVLDDFYNHGIDRYSLKVVLDGWQEFGFDGVDDYYQFFLFFI
jgi:hypothetical protein